MSTSAKNLALQMIRKQESPPGHQRTESLNRTEDEGLQVQQDALAGMLVALRTLPHALNVLGMRAEGSTMSADCAGEVIDRLDETPTERPAPPAGWTLDGMLHEAAPALNSDPQGRASIDALYDAHFEWTASPHP